MPAGDDHGVLVCAVARLERDAREVERGEQVGVPELGGEADAEKVEGPDRTVRVDGELREAVLPQQLLHVGPDGVGALRQGVRSLVEDLVEDHDALVGQSDLVRVRIHQGPPHGLVAGDVPVLGLAVELPAHVLDGLGHA
jgi:hypothetical protein